MLRNMDAANGEDMDINRGEYLCDECDADKERAECENCGDYIEDDLDPAGFRCPVCRSRKPAFRDIGPRTKASGFEENLNFGIGVNRMTPGQKNVLIFGGLALAFAFFLSLYSLR